jgi:hypothetical protein
VKENDLSIVLMGGHALACPWASIGHADKAEDDSFHVNFPPLYNRIHGTIRGRALTLDCNTSQVDLRR